MTVDLHYLRGLIRAALQAQLVENRLDDLVAS